MTDRPSVCAERAKLCRSRRARAPSRSAASPAGRNEAGSVAGPWETSVPKCGVVARKVAWPHAVVGSRSATNAAAATSLLIDAATRRASRDDRRSARRRGRRGASPTRRRPSRRSRRAGAPTRPPDEREREDRREHERPPEQVVQERRPREEPRILLVDEERRAAVTNASGQVSRQSGDVSRPRTSASSAPPASMSTSAHEPCAYMWIAEFVKNAITGQSSTPSTNATVGQRYARQRRARHTSWPTSASQRRHSPTNRITAPNAQWIISARGCIRLLEIRDDGSCHEQGERHSDERRRRAAARRAATTVLLPGGAAG